MAEPPTGLADIQALNAETLNLMRQGQYAEARLSGERTLGIAESVLGVQHAEVAVALRQLGTIYTFLEKYADAELSFRRALAIQEAAWGPEHPGLAATLHNLAHAYRRKARYDDADDLYRRAAGILERDQGPMSVDLAFVLEGHAASNEESGHYDVAEALYRRALVIQEGKPTPDQALARLLNNLALLLWKTGKSDEAERLSLRSIDIFEELLGPGHPLVADCLFDLASNSEVRGQYQKAEGYYRRAVAIQETRLPAFQIHAGQVVVPNECLTLAQSLLALARVCERLSKHGEAERVRARVHYTADHEPFAGAESVPGLPGWVDAPIAGPESVPGPPPEGRLALDESRDRSRQWWHFWK